MSRDSYPNSFASWFTGTVACNVEHPVYGRYQITAYQLARMSTAEYRNALFNDIQKAFKNDDYKEIMENKLKEFVKNG